MAQVLRGEPWERDKGRQDAQRAKGRIVRRGRKTYSGISAFKRRGGQRGLTSIMREKKGGGGNFAPRSREGGMGMSGAWCYNGGAVDQPY